MSANRDTRVVETTLVGQRKVMMSWPVRLSGDSRTGGALNLFFGGLPPDLRKKCDQQTAGSVWGASKSRPCAGRGAVVDWLPAPLEGGHRTV